MNTKLNNPLKLPVFESSQWQEKEQALKVRLKAFLEQVIQNKLQHSRWLNTLAFLEYIGCRKIIKSQHSDNLTLMLLQHISEEARHAYHFKKLAHKISPKDVHDFKEEKTLKGSLAEDYFQAVDHGVKEDLNNMNETLNYFYTTWLIEERALMVYNVYNPILKANHFPFNLDFILKEEAGHLQTTVHFICQQDMSFEKRASRLFTFEAEQFSQLLKAWSLS